MNYLAPTKVSLFLIASIFISMTVAFADDEQPAIDYLSFAQGAVPIATQGASKPLKVGIDHALLAIDGNRQGFGLTPKPGGPDTEIIFIYKLPALTTFSDFAIPNVLETPSPSQTFISKVEISGSDKGPDGPFETLASANLTIHAHKNELTSFKAEVEIPVQWVRLSLSGGTDVQTDKIFFEFSEIIGHGSQEAVPLLNAFTGKWKGRGLLLELKQDNAQVTGCYDGVGDITGTVEGNLLRATGKTRSGGIPSSFLLTVSDDGEISGVRSTNGAPFRYYEGADAPNISTECSEQAAPILGCGAIIHGIKFDFDSATIRPESEALLDTLSNGLKSANAAGITVIGHTSSEGSDEYNEKLSQRRAQSVVEALITRGTESSKISAEGLGEKQPIADNTTGAGRALNRRVEISCR